MEDGNRFSHAKTFSFLGAMCIASSGCDTNLALEAQWETSTTGIQSPYEAVEVGDQLRSTAVEAWLADDGAKDFLRLFSAGQSVSFALHTPDGYAQFEFTRAANFELQGSDGQFFVGRNMRDHSHATIKVLREGFVLWYSESGNDYKVAPYQTFVDRGSDAKDLQEVRRVGEFGVRVKSQGFVQDAPDHDASMLKANLKRDNGTGNCGVKGGVETSMRPRTPLSMTVSNEFVGKRHVIVNLWQRDSTIGDKNEIERILLDSTSANHTRATNHWKLRDAYVVVKWRERSSKGNHPIDIPWDSDPDRFLDTWKSWIDDNATIAANEAHILVTEHAWGSTKGIAWMRTPTGQIPLGTEWAVGLAADDEEATVSHEFSHIMGAEHTSLWYDFPAYHADLMHDTIGNPFFVDHAWHGYDKSFDTLSNTLSRVERMPQNSINVGTLAGARLQTWVGNNSNSGSHKIVSSIGWTQVLQNSDVYTFQVPVAGAHRVFVSDASGFSPDVVVLDGESGSEIGSTAGNAPLDLNLVSGHPYIMIVGSVTSSDSGSYRVNIVNNSPVWCWHEGASLYHGDFNGDGKDDLLCKDNSHFWQILGLSNPQTSGLSGWCVHQGSWMTVEDENQDGRDDLVCRDTAGMKWVLHSDSSGVTL